MAQLIANRYAKAFFELAVENNTIDEMEQEIKVIYEAFVNNKDIIKIINNPEISSKEKSNIVNEIFKINVSESTSSLINFMLLKNREEHILEVFELFLSKVNDYKGITTAYIASAIQLTDKNISDIKANLSKKLNKQVNVELIIDTTLIGGLCIKVDDLIIDSSIKKQLSDIKKDLLGLQLV